MVTDIVGSRSETIRRSESLEHDNLGGERYYAVVSDGDVFVDRRFFHEAARSLGYGAQVGGELFGRITSLANVGHLPELGLREFKEAPQTAHRFGKKYLTVSLSYLSNNIGDIRCVLDNHAYDKESDHNKWYWRKASSNVHEFAELIASIYKDIVIDEGNSTATID